MATEEEVVRYLHELEWPVSPQVFNGLFRAWVTTTFELVVLVKGWRGLKVVLLTRPEDDTERPGMLHVPGTVMRRGDTKVSALSRLIRELEGARLSELKFVDLLDFPMGNGPDECARGQIVQRLYTAYLEGGTLPPGAVLSDSASLPIEKFGWPFHRHLVARAVEWHKTRRF